MTQPLNQSPEIGALIDITGQGGAWKYIVFPYFPASMTEEKQNNWAQVDIIARSEPVIGYGHSGPRTCTLELMFAATTDIQSEVLDKVDFIRSFDYPEYAAGGPLPPHVAHLALGDIIAMDCVLVNYRVEYTAPYTATARALPYIAHVSTTWYETSKVPWQFSHVRAGLDNRNGTYNNVTGIAPVVVTTN